ncbi:hypothetical protein [Tychonema sp. BBK16]|uniref:hypothetical protein n=1 Tax=Tychonema sp. BBK16 TaxID=2699888 RepID=UPI001F3D473C|nr:hypothetical protein [Tychonema sp. BBK16]MCF6375834.1 hypothetical protein [Tychonema sp. BBK16]
MKISNKKKWLKVTEFTVVGIATCLNPHAGFLLFLLKLCFQILTALQKDDPSETDKDKRTTRCLPDRQQSDREAAITRRSLPHTPVKSTKEQKLN